MNDELKDVEGSGLGLILVVPNHLPGGTEGYSENLTEDSQCLGRDSNEHFPNSSLELLRPLYSPSFFSSFQFVIRL
jgi:hypothetical protein